MLLHYLVKVETPKIHVTATSAFNVNYKIAVTCIKLYCQFHKMFWWTISMNIHVRACVRSAHHQRAHTHDLRWSRHWFIVASIMSEVKSNQVCITHFRRTWSSESFHTRIAVYHLKYVHLRHMMTVVHLMKVCIHLVQFSLVISCFNITFSVFRFHNIV